MDVELLVEVRTQVEPSDFDNVWTRLFVLGWACMGVPANSQSAKLISDCSSYQDFIQALDLLIEVATMGPVAA